MKPRINFVTLAVKDLKRSLRFYRNGLGLRTKGIVGGAYGEDAKVVFIKMNPGLILALWSRKALAKEAGVKNGRPNSAEFSLAHNVNNKAAVDKVIAQAKRAGAKITAPAADRVWGGYTGYFRDPDGHLWEIAWNPAIRIKD